MTVEFKVDFHRAALSEKDSRRLVFHCVIIIISSSSSSFICLSSTLLIASLTSFAELDLPSDRSEGVQSETTYCISGACCTTDVCVLPPLPAPPPHPHHHLPWSQHMTYFVTGLRQVQSETAVVFCSHVWLLVFIYACRTTDVSVPPPPPPPPCHST